MKVVLREAIQGIVPDAIRRLRDKMGYATPEQVWLCQTEPQWFQRSVMASAEAAPELFDRDRVGKLVDDVIAQRQPFSTIGWRILCLGRWLMNLNEDRPVAPAVANRPIADAAVPAGRQRVTSRRPLKVLVVTPVYPTPNDAQAGIFIRNQITHLSRQGIDCRVMTYHPSPPPFPLWVFRRSWVQYYWRRLRSPGAPGGIPVAEVFYQRRWIDDEDVVPAIGEALADYVAQHPEYHDVDVIYAHWLWTGGAAALALREQFGWPVVAIARGSEMHDWHAVRPHCRPYVERVLREADCILANCEDLRARADALVPGSSARMRVIYNGCDSEIFRPSADRSSLRQALGLNLKRVLLFCGDIIERKGIPELTEVWNSFSAMHKGWILVMVGAIVDRNLKDRLQQAGNGQVIFTGRLSHEQVLNYMQAADAYIQPSRLEGLSNATMEAMAVGLPVVTTDTSGQRELIQAGINGWLIPTGDVVALRRALDELARDQQLAERLGVAARETIATRFDPQRETERLAELLSETAERSKQGRQPGMAQAESYRELVEPAEKGTARPNGTSRRHASSFW